MSKFKMFKSVSFEIIIDLSNLAEVVMRGSHFPDQNISTIFQLINVLSN